MLIDGFTVAAQAVNFLILAWLLRRFLYRPILKAVDERERTIESRLADAAAQAAGAETRSRELETAQARFEAAKADLLAKAREEAAAERERLLGAARAEAQAARRALAASAADEAGRLEKSLRARAQEEIFAVAARAVKDLADESFDDRVALVFARRLRALDAVGKGRLAAAGSEPLVRSAFALSEAARAAISGAIREIIPAPAPRFEIAPERVSGIEFSAGAGRVSWTLDRYLAALRQEVGGEAALVS